jgi:hypothetical protein
MENSKLKLCACVLSVCILLLAGCKKKEDASGSTPVDTNTNVTAQTAPAAEASPAPSPVELNSSIAEIQKARETKDYDKAADVFLSMGQRKRPLPPAQAEIANREMQRFQGELAAAIARGDPRAKAAADKLRQASMPR